MKLQKMVPTADTSLSNYRERDRSKGDFQTDISFHKANPILYTTLNHREKGSVAAGFLSDF